MKKKYLAKRKTTVLVYQGKEQKIYGTDRPEVGSIPAISGIPAIEYRNRNSRYFFKNSVFHSIPLQNASIPFQIAGILKTRAPKKKKKRISAETSIYRSGLANHGKHEVIVGVRLRTNTRRCLIRIRLRSNRVI